MNEIPPTPRKPNPSVLCFGDSWSYGNYPALVDQIKKNNHAHVKVSYYHRYGETAEHFAKNPNILPDVVTRCDADYILLSLGGNDFKNFYWKRQQIVAPWTAVNFAEEQLRIVLDALYKEHPNMKVITYGYDFMGDMGDYIDYMFKDHDKGPWIRRAYDWVGIPLINYSLSLMGKAYKRLEKHYTSEGLSFTYIPVWGSLQSVEPGINNNWSLWRTSQLDHMHDPLHASEKGYQKLIGHVYDGYFKKEFEIPVVSPSESETSQQQ